MRKLNVPGTGLLFALLFAFSLYAQRAPLVGSDGGANSGYTGPTPETERLHGMDPNDVATAMKSNCPNFEACLAVAVDCLRVEKNATTSSMLMPHICYPAAYKTAYFAPDDKRIAYGKALTMVYRWHWLARATQQKFADLEFVNYMVAVDQAALAAALHLDEAHDLAFRKAQENLALYSRQKGYDKNPPPMK